MWESISVGGAATTGWIKLGLGIFTSGGMVYPTNIIYGSPAMDHHLYSSASAADEPICGGTHTGVWGRDAPNMTGIFYSHPRITPIAVNVGSSE